MPRAYASYLADMLAAIEAVQRYTGELNESRFVSSPMVIDAVCFNLIVLGEAARRIPPIITDRYPDVEWRMIVGLRNLLAHEYFRRNLERLWDIVQVALPELRGQLLTILGDGGQAPG